MLYWSGYTDSAAITTFDNAFTLGANQANGMAFKRIQDVNSNAKMFESVLQSPR